MYKVVWKKTALKQLAKIDRTMAKKLADKVENFLAKDPINRGERLLYKYKGFYRYRCYDVYRVIYQIRKEENLILVADAGHRKEIY